MTRANPGGWQTLVTSKQNLELATSVIPESGILAVNTVYVIAPAESISLSLPATADDGDRISVVKNTNAELVIAVDTANLCFEHETVTFTWNSSDEEWNITYRWVFSPVTTTLNTILFTAQTATAESLVIETESYSALSLYYAYTVAVDSEITVKVMTSEDGIAGWSEIVSLTKAYGDPYASDELALDSTEYLVIPGAPLYIKLVIDSVIGGVTFDARITGTRSVLG